MSDIQVNPITDDLLASFEGRRVRIGYSPVGALKAYLGRTGTVVAARHDNIVETGILLTIRLDSGKRVAACYNEIHFLSKDAQRAEGSYHG